MTPKKRVTIYDIAKKLNLTASSVSRALNNSIHVKEDTKALIVKTAAEMNYKPNTLASNLRKGKSQTIGVVMPRINQNFFANVIAGLEEATYKRGYNLVICQSNESHQKEIQCVNTLINQHVDCIVISVCVEGDDYSHLQNVIDQHIPLIQVDRVVDSLDTLKVINDNEQASYDAVAHMIQQGYKRIGLLQGPQNMAIYRQRTAGYINALKDAGLPFIDELVVASALTRELGAISSRQLLNLPQPPDAIFASTSDFSALGVLEVATAMGFKVPDDLGICGYANEDFTEITSPSITTIDQFSYEMGKTVADLFFREMDNKGKEAVIAPRVISVRPKLIVRSSTRRVG